VARGNDASLTEKMHRYIVQKRQRHRINILERDDSQVVAVLAMASINPHVSICQIQRKLGIPKSTEYCDP